MPRAAARVESIPKLPPEERRMVPDTSKTIHSGSGLRHPSRSEPGPSSAELIVSFGNVVWRGDSLCSSTSTSTRWMSDGH